ncbi:MAG: nucleoside-specific outer membrane channel protein Tsx, partial [Gammaproteobacteria bacterium]
MSNIIKYFVLIAFSNPLLADDFFEWTTTNIQFLHGSGFELGSNKRSLFRIEHTNSWRYGKNFTFVDVTQRDDFGTELYGEWYSGLSLNKLTNEDFSIGIIRDFSFLAGINAGNDPKDDPFKAYLLGVEMSFAVPGDGFFNLGVLARKSDDVRTVG